MTWLSFTVHELTELIHSTEIMPTKRGLNNFGKHSQRPLILLYLLNGIPHFTKHIHTDVSLSLSLSDTHTHVCMHAMLSLFLPSQNPYSQHTHTYIDKKVGGHLPSRQF